MATLRETFHNIAESIRAKGIEGTMTPLEMPEKIASIPSGQTIAHEKNLNLWIPDGTLLYSYTKDEVLADGWNLPDIPDWTIEWQVGNEEDGYTIDKIPMTAQEWNWSKPQIVEMMGLCDRLDVCAIYKPTDNSSHFLIDIRENISNSLTINCNQVGSGAVVDWGDGESQNLTTTSTSHIYESQKLYHLKITTPRNYKTALGRSTSQTFLGTVSSATAENRGRLRKAILSDNTTLYTGAFYQHQKLDTLILSKLYSGNQPNLGQVCYDAQSLRFVGFPKTYTVLGNEGYRSCSNLTVASLSSGVTGIGTSVFRDCQVLRGAQLPTSSNFGDYTFYGNDSGFKTYYYPGGAVNTQAFQSAYMLHRITLSPRTVDIRSNAFASCNCLERVEAKGNITSIQANSFLSCNKLTTIDLRNNTSVPTLGSKNAFSGLPSYYRIIVPDALYDDWIAATNWSDASIVSHIMKQSDWNAEHPDDILP